MNRAELMDSYFESYRAKLAEMRAISDDIKQLDFRKDLLRQKLKDLSNETNSMQRMITKCINEGIDPVQARLSTDGFGDLSMDNMFGETMGGTILTGAVGASYPIVNSGGINTAGGMVTLAGAHQMVANGGYAFNSMIGALGAVGPTQ